jgi:hypothetical protein
MYRGIYVTMYRVNRRRTIQNCSFNLVYEVVGNHGDFVIYQCMLYITG